LLLAGDSILSLGVGLTETPAADVRGIVSTETDNSTITANIDASEKNNEETESLNVIEKEKQTIIMQIKDIKDINDESLKQISASAITKFIEEKLAATSEDWKKKVDEKETAASTLSAEIATVKAELETIKTEKDDLGKKLSDLESAALAKEADEAFQNRMTLIDDKFELSDEDRQFVVEEVKACASAEDFDKWMNKFSVLAKEKSKEVIAAKAKELEDLRKNISVVKASEEGETKTEVKTEEVKTEEKVAEKTEEKVAEKVAEVISEAKVKTEIPNSQAAQESLKDRMAKAFSGDNVKVSYRK
jgi:hypothetical protein